MQQIRFQNPTAEDLEVSAPQGILKVQVKLSPTYGSSFMVPAGCTVWVEELCWLIAQTSVL